MVTYIKAGPGKIFVLTDKGKQVSRVAVKYIKGSTGFQEKYRWTAPTAWIDNGYIEEKEYGGNK